MCKSTDSSQKTWISGAKKYKKTHDHMIVGHKIWITHCCLICPTDTINCSSTNFISKTGNWMEFRYPWPLTVLFFWMSGVHCLCNPQWDSCITHVEMGLEPGEGLARCNDLFRCRLRWVDDLLGPSPLTTERPQRKRAQPDTLVSKLHTKGHNSCHRMSLKCQVLARHLTNIGSGIYIVSVEFCEPLKHPCSFRIKEVHQTFPQLINS